jgi:hypothetical protein
MPVVDSDRAEKLVTLARERFDPDLREPEERILRHSAGYANPAMPATDAQRIELRAAFVRWLATDLDAAKLIDLRGIRVSFVRFREVLDLDRCVTDPALSFVDCTFDEKLTLRSAKLRGLYLRRVNAAKIIDLALVRLEGALVMREVEVAGEVNLRGATVEGPVTFREAKLHSSEVALRLEGATIRGDLVLGQRFRAYGKVHLAGIEIGQDFDAANTPN